jgi:hypothetical protein
MIPARFTIFPVLAALSSLMLINAAFGEGEIEVQFVSFPKLIDAKPVELLVGEGKTMEVELPTNSISPVYKAKALGKWVIGKTVVDEERKESFEVYGQAPAIASPKQLVLVIRKGKDDSDGLELIPMDNQKSNFGGGKYFLMNATRVDIAGSIGTGKFSLEPNNHALIAPQPTKTKGDGKYCYAQIYFRKNEEIQPFFTSTWRFSENARTMVFFYHDPQTKQLKLHTIRDYVN